MDVETQIPITLKTSEKHIVLGLGEEVKPKDYTKFAWPPTKRTSATEVREALFFIANIKTLITN